MQEIRVRIAPSPTGYLHVGTARTALYNFLFARKNKGKFILRIEDTDKDRSSDEMTDIILEGLKWLKIDWDEGPVFQSDYFEHYKEYIKELEKSNKIYKCFCTKEELEERKQSAIANKIAWKYDRKCFSYSKEEIEKGIAENIPFVYRIRIPDGKTSFDDLIHERIEKDNSEIEDFVIFRSDMSPIYNFAVVIDDIRMNITHVIRGDDHISNTFKQIHIYSALNRKEPFFAHLPLILDENKKKLSKRTGTVSVLAFKEMGILPEAFVNFIALIGWNPGGEDEIFSMLELVDKFSLERVTKKGGVFDYKKLEWMNSKYITNYDTVELIKLLEPFYKESGINLSEYENPWLISVMNSVKEKARYLKDFPQLTDFYFNDIIEYNEKGLIKYIDERRVSFLKDLLEILRNIDDFSIENIEHEYREYAEKNNLKGADVIHPSRLVLTGIMEGPPLFELMAVLGKNRVLERLTKFIESDIL